MRNFLQTLILSAAALACSTNLGAQDGGTSHAILNLATPSMFADTFRATFIARGYIVDVDHTTRFDQPIFRPIEYIMGTAIDAEEIPLVINSNADMSFLKGQEVVCAVIAATNGTYGPCFGFESLTPANLSPSTSKAFYEDILAANAPYTTEIMAALEENPTNCNFNFPWELKVEWAKILVKYMGYTGTHAAHHAYREMLHNPVFKDILWETEDENLLQLISDYVGISSPGTFDRGYGVLTLWKYQYPGVSIQKIMELVRNETAYLNIDHMAKYLTLFDKQQVVDAAADIYTNKQTESIQARRNAIFFAGAFGSTLACETLLPLVGREGDTKTKHVLLDALCELPHKDNFGTLAKYVNGGDKDHLEGIQTDCLDSRLLLKRALLAIALIDSQASNVYIDGAYIRAKPLWLRQYLQYLTRPNKEWRKLVNLSLLEGDTVAAVPGEEEPETEE